MDRLELLETAEFIIGRQDRTPGGGLCLVRNALQMSPHELAVELETTERQIRELEANRDTAIPEVLDRRLRQFYLSH